MMMIISRNNWIVDKKQEVVKLMKMYRLRSVIWEMDVGLIIILHLKSKLDNIGLQKSLLVETMILQQMCGVLLALSLKWLQEISYLNQEKDKTMIKMMITWPK